MFWTKKRCKGLWGSRCINKRHALFVGSAGCGLSEDLTFEQAVKGRRRCWRPYTQSGRIEIQMQAGWSQVLFMFLKRRIWSSDLGPSATSHTLLLGPWTAWWGRGPSMGVNWWCRARGAFSAGRLEREVACWHIPLTLCMVLSGLHWGAGCTGSIGSANWGRSQLQTAGTG